MPDPRDRIGLQTTVNDRTAIPPEENKKVKDAAVDDAVRTSQRAAVAQPKPLAKDQVNLQPDPSQQLARLGSQGRGPGRSDCYK